MIKAQVKELLDTCFARGVARGLWSEAASGSYSLELPRHEAHGDFSTNMAMVIAGRDRKNPRQVAEQLKTLLEEDSSLLDRLEVAGPGFVNLFVKDEACQAVLPALIEQGRDYGLSDIGQGRKVLVEFVSANPTGPLSVGHGRQAILGDAIARLLAATGHRVTREYYYNNAGRQMRVLGESCRARYLEALGLESCFPEDGYQGDYIREIAAGLVRDKGDSLKDCQEVEPFKEAAEKAIFADISATLERFGICFDNYYNERSLYEKGLVDDVVACLRQKGLVYDHDGAVWFKTTEFGMDKDRVIIKSSGEPTYRLPDIAYHREKFRRGFDWLVDIFGSDHIGTVPDVLAGVRALGYDDSRVSVVIHQFVTLTRHGKQVKMSTRKATFVTVDELLDEVGPDVARFIFLTRKADSQLEFDLNLAARESQENPVYYVQYANARLASIRKQAAARGVDRGPLADTDLTLLSLPAERKMLKSMAGYADLVESAALALEPHRIIFFLIDLAGQFHSYYNQHKVISDDPELTRARLWLAHGLQQVFSNGLRVVGLSAPERM
ncbi:MAG: arginine--tRNA ligase [Desulfobacterales bacterium]|nr:arginine--tRNA ligase [Desulfobacterales bacterium]